MPKRNKPLGQSKIPEYCTQRKRIIFLWKIKQNLIAFLNFQIDWYPTIWRAAVHETGVSRHHGGQIESTLESPRTSQHYRIEGFNRLLNWASIMLRGVSLLDHYVIFFLIFSPLKILTFPSEVVQKQCTFGQQSLI